MKTSEYEHDEMVELIKKTLLRDEHNSPLSLTQIRHMTDWVNNIQRYPITNLVVKSSINVEVVLGLDDLIDRIEKGNHDYYILLNGHARSSKYITYNDKVFYITNEIDGSSQELSKEQLYTDSNIADAINKGNLFQY